MLKRLLNAVVLLLIFGLNGGCASIIKGSHDQVMIHSTEKETQFMVDGAPVGRDTAVVQLKKGKPHVIEARKEGCETVIAKTGEKFDGTTLLGILIDWGIISIPVDLMSGSAWKIEPTSYTVNPMCKKPADDISKVSDEDLKKALDNVKDAPSENKNTP